MYIYVPCSLPLMSIFSRLLIQTSAYLFDTLVTGKADGGGGGALKIALHCSANSEHCVLRRTGGNRCACQ